MRVRASVKKSANTVKLLNAKALLGLFARRIQNTNNVKDNIIIQIK